MLPNATASQSMYWPLPRYNPIFTKLKTAPKGGSIGAFDYGRVNNTLTESLTAALST